jgi:PAS domain S-box-containing protein
MKKKDKSEEKYQKQLFKLNRRITELEKMEIARQRAEAELRRIEEIYFSFFKQSKDPLVLIQDRLVRFVSPPMPKLLGYTPEEVINAPFASFVPPDELPRLVEYYLQRIAGKDVPPIYRMVLKHRNGQDVHVEISAGVVTHRGMPADFIIIKKLAEIPPKGTRRAGPEGLPGDQQEAAEPSPEGLP